MLAWETTSDDVSTVLEMHGVELDDEKVEEITDFQLDHDAVIKAALRGDDMLDQIDLAHCEIADQLTEIGVI